MVSKKNVANKAGFRMAITCKQSQFKRFRSRYNSAKNPTEKRFLKAEAVRICRELKQCSKQWKNCGFGACGWITANFTTANFTKGSKNSKRTSRTHRAKGRRYARRGYSRRSHARRTSWTSTRRSNNRRNTRSRYVAW
jgi:hypothetical protein